MKKDAAAAVEAVAAARGVDGRGTKRVRGKKKGEEGVRERRGGF